MRLPLDKQLAHDSEPYTRIGGQAALGIGEVAAPVGAVGKIPGATGVTGKVLGDFPRTANSLPFVTPMRRCLLGSRPNVRSIELILDIGSAPRTERWVLSQKKRKQVRGGDFGWRASCFILRNCWS